MNSTHPGRCLHMIHPHKNSHGIDRPYGTHGTCKSRKMPPMFKHDHNPRRLIKATCQADSGEVARIPRADDVLPDNLPDAIKQASEATAKALATGASRCTVEILLPEFWDPLSGPVFKEEGDQRRFWMLTRRFVENLTIATECKNVRVMYPDMGVAAMLENQWEDKKFKLGSMNDRVLVDPNDDLIVIAAPDPLASGACQKLAGGLSGDQTLVMFNPRLVSGDVGVGLNVRRLRADFLKTFVTSYSLSPIGDVGSILRRYPGTWQIFVEDENLPGRYKLVAERDERPSGDMLNAIIAGDMETGDPGESRPTPGLLNQLASTVSSFQRFLKSLSN